MPRFHAHSDEDSRHPNPLIHKADGLVRTLSYLEFELHPGRFNVPNFSKNGSERWGT